MTSSSPRGHCWEAGNNVNPPPQRTTPSSTGSYLSSSSNYHRGYYCEMEYGITSFRRKIEEHISYSPTHSVVMRFLNCFHHEKPTLLINRRNCLLLQLGRVMTTAKIKAIPIPHQKTSLAFSFLI